MPEGTVRSDVVDVEQIMQQIRTRVREKRGAAYTDAEVTQLATDALQRFSGPGGLPADVIERFRERAEQPLSYEGERGIRRIILRLMHPFLKRIQKQMMADFRLYFEVTHNLVVEVTRLGIEVNTLKMRVESLSSRLDFDERRARAFEAAGQSRPGAAQRSRPEPSPAAPASVPASSWPGRPAAAPDALAASTPAPTSSGTAAPAATSSAPQGQGGRPDGTARPDGERRRRRRRRRRRPGQGPAEQPGQVASGGPQAPGALAAAHAAAANDQGDDGDDGGDDGPDGPDGDEGASDQ